ncbi:MAG: peptide chain release factor N(5)-glutamine methyltransferase [Verrucomicrobiota bacterium]
MKSVLETVQAGTAYLEKRGVPEARRNMEFLVAEVLSCSRLDLYLEFDRPLEEKELAPLRELLKRRGEREPLQHILGSVPFCGLDFRCDERGLIPRPETELLAEECLRLELPERARLLDVGTGSGVIGLTLAERLPESEVVLVDLSREALALARENAQALGLRVDLRESDLFSAVEGTFDLVVANLPYIESGDLESLQPEVQRDPVAALDGGADGLALYRRFARDCTSYLAKNGFVALEVGARQGEAVAALLRENGLRHVEVKDDLAGIDRMVFARKSSPEHG